MDEPGLLAGRFRVEASVARGTLGDVLRAHDAEDDAFVALKLASARVAGLEHFAATLDRELSAAASVRHPGLAELRGWGATADGLPWVATRWIDGGELRSRVAHGGLPPEDVQLVVEQLADALDAVHAAGQLHGDVKPGNVLLRETPTGLRAYLTDLGTARALLTAGASAAVTATADAVGAPAGLAPELAQGADPSPAADRYGLACVAFEALTGTPPFTAPSLGGMLVAHATRPRPRATERRPGLPFAVDRVLIDGLAFAPAERPPTATAFAARLAGALGLADAPGEVELTLGPGATPAAPPAAPYVPAAPPRRRRAPLLAAVLLAVAAGATAGVLLATAGGDGSQLDVPTVPPAPRIRVDSADLPQRPAGTPGLGSRTAFVDAIREWGNQNEDPFGEGYDQVVAPQATIDAPDDDGRCVLAKPAPTAPVNRRPVIRYSLAQQDDRSLPVDFQGLAPSVVVVHGPRLLSWRGTWIALDGTRGRLRLWGTRDGENALWRLLLVDLCPDTKGTPA